MQETQLIESKRISQEIGLKLMDINEQSRNYIHDVILLVNKEIGIDKILSIILFGSQLKNHHQRGVSQNRMLSKKMILESK